MLVGLFLVLSRRDKLAGIHVLRLWRKTTKHLPANLFSPMAKYRLLVYSAHEIHFLQVIIGRGDLGNAFIHVVIFQA